MTIGKYLKEQRQKKGLTQEDLAEKTDISVRTIQRIENDDVDPRTYTLQAIAEALDLDYEKLLNIDGEVVDKQASNDNLWITLLHLSGLFNLVIPPLVIWIIQRDKVKSIKEHAIDVMNFQLSMFIYFMIGGFLVFLIIGLPIVIFLGIYSTVVVIFNTVRVVLNQSYRYPMSMKIIK